MPYTTATLECYGSVNPSHQLWQPCLAFGGVDIVVNNAGHQHFPAHWPNIREENWDKLYDILVKGQFLVSQARRCSDAQAGFRRRHREHRFEKRGGGRPQQRGLRFRQSRPGPPARLLAAELGPDRIRVNTVNPDAVIAGSNIWSGGWAEGRAKAYGITVEELPAYYAKRTLLNEIILPEDIANACFAFVGGLLSKSTGNALNVDGGVAMGFLR